MEMLACDQPVLMGGVNEEDNPRSQSPWDELTAGVYSSSSEWKTFVLVINVGIFYVLHFGFKVYHFVALGLGLSWIILITVLHF